MVKFVDFKRLFMNYMQNEDLLNLSHFKLFTHGNILNYQLQGSARRIKTGLNEEKVVSFIKDLLALLFGKNDCESVWKKISNRNYRQLPKGFETSCGKLEFPVEYGVNKIKVITIRIGNQQDENGLSYKTYSVEFRNALLEEYEEQWVS